MWKWRNNKCAWAYVLVSFYKWNQKVKLRKNKIIFIQTVMRGKFMWFSKWKIIILYRILFIEMTANANKIFQNLRFCRIKKKIRQISKKWENKKNYYVISIFLEWLMTVDVDLTLWNSSFSFSFSYFSFSLLLSF